MAKPSKAPTAASTNTGGTANVHPMEELLGPFLVTHSNKIISEVPTMTALKGQKLVLLYFSASWCPPCQSFTPLLANFQLQFGKKANMTIVYVSSDRSVEDFTEYYTTKMPWLAIPLFEHEGHKRRSKLAKDVFGISGIPTLVVLDAATGLFVTADARAQILGTAGQSSDTIYQELIVNKWIRGPRLTLEQAVAAPGYVWQVISFLTKSLATIASNPAYIIGAAYLFRWAVRKYFAKKGDLPLDAAEAPTSNPIPDDEF